MKLMKMKLCMSLISMSLITAFASIQRSSNSNEWAECNEDNNDIITAIIRQLGWNSWSLVVFSLTYPNIHNVPICEIRSPCWSECPGLRAKWTCACARTAKPCPCALGILHGYTSWLSYVTRVCSGEGESEGAGRQKEEQDDQAERGYFRTNRLLLFIYCVRISPDNNPRCSFAPQLS